MKQKTIKFFLLNTLFFITFSVHAQNATPVAKDISVLVTNTSVQITWKRAEPYTYSPEMFFRIYRDTKPLTRLNLNAKTLVAEQDSSQLIYSEEITDNGQYYYAVLAVKNNEFVCGSIIPGVNSTTSPVNAHFAGKIIQPKSQISNFCTISKDNSVIITYTSENPGNRLCLYRCEKPFTKISAFSEATLVSTFTDAGTPLVDFPPANRNFYYALIEESELLTGEVLLKIGNNTTARPIAVSISQNDTKQNVQGKRAAPLPQFYNSIEAKGKNTEENIKEYPLLDELLAEKSATNNGKNLAPQNLHSRQNVKLPFVFNSEKQNDTYLAQIVNQYFASENWHTARQELLAYLETYQSGKTVQSVARANFYLGECYYFMGNKHDALLYFLNARAQYPVQSAEWIDAVLD